MHAFVFAAGRGTRLRPYTDETPKPLLEVGGEPILERSLRRLVDAGVDRFVLVVGYRREAIVDRVGESIAGVPITYAVQHERQGLAHAVRRAIVDGYDATLPPMGAGWGSDPDATSLPPSVPEDVVLVNGDNVFADDCDLSRLVDRHRESGVDGVLLLDRVSRNEAEATAYCDLTSDGTVRSIDASVGGSAGSDDAASVAAGVQTHDTAALLSACLAVTRADSDGDEYELADALESLVDRRRYVGIELEGWHLNVNTPADLEAARRRLGGE
ncbi:glucose-1-phosphate thymidylyltransferase [Halobiforma haloterrestris]|uniref:Glucose-1-phosphate thymidylyltransferase n=1 Tax=Natronobacterium haloterrestre TaxID=148448 RepID=A0A1I1K3Z2_NATHA|nr:nucleotidyltransferase family protein [Halobiforma haloterrestris]SFC55446.1 glucose-1-phosphate thymidylyltransferase [Halobiforma haloterrestris]